MVHRNVTGFELFRALQKPMVPSVAVIVDLLRFHGLSCREFPVSVWLGARCTGMQFTRFADRSTTSSTRYGEYLFRGEFSGLHCAIVQRS